MTTNIQRATFHDLDDIIDMGSIQYAHKSLLGTYNQDIWKYNLGKILWDSIHNSPEHLFVVHRSTPSTAIDGDRSAESGLIGYLIANAVNPHHTRQRLLEVSYLHTSTEASTRNRIASVKLLLGAAEEFAQRHYYDGIISSSYLETWKSFMRLHSQLGYDIRGSIAYKEFRYD